MLLEDGLGELASHGSTAAKGQEEPDTFTGGLTTARYRFGISWVWRREGGS